MKIEIIYWNCNDNNELMVFERYHEGDGPENASTYYSIWETTVAQKDVLGLYEPNGIEKYMMEHETDGCSVAGSWREIRNELDDYTRKYIAAIMSYMNEFDCSPDEAIVCVEQSIGCGMEL